MTEASRRLVVVPELGAPGARDGARGTLAAPGAPAAPGTPSAPLRTLCLHEDPATLVCLSAALPVGLELVASTDPARALDRLESIAFAIVVAALDAPGIDGLAFLSAVKARSPLTVCLALTRRPPGAVQPSSAVFETLLEGQPPHVLRQVLARAAREHVALATAVSRARGSESGGSSGAEPPGSADRMALDVAGRAVELVEGTTLVGRSRACDLPLLDPYVSRRHASFSYAQGHLAVRNLSGTNRVQVNGGALGRGESCSLHVGDRVTLGSREIRICAAHEARPSVEPTLRAPQGGAGSPAGSSQAGLGALVELAAKCLLLGNVREAERVLRPSLEALLERCGQGAAPRASERELAAELALRIAEGKATGEWVDYVFDLYAASDAPLPPMMIDRLRRTIPAIASISIGRYRAYVQRLVAQLDRLGPAERFLVRRIQGLESRIMMSAHV